MRVSHGGRDTLDNMVPLCHPHHRAFHDGEEWVIEALEKVAPSYFRSLT
jgi:predicted restriction endonuclease